RTVQLPGVLLGHVGRVKRAHLLGDLGRVEVGHFRLPYLRSDLTPARSTSDQPPTIARRSCQSAGERSNEGRDGGPIPGPRAGAPMAAGYWRADRKAADRRGVPVASRARSEAREAPRCAG